MDYIKHIIRCMFGKMQTIHTPVRTRYTMYTMHAEVSHHPAHSCTIWHTPAISCNRLALVSHSTVGEYNRCLCIQISVLCIRLFWLSFQAILRSMQTTFQCFRMKVMHLATVQMCKVAWPSGLRRWFKAPVSSGAWVRIPPLPQLFLYFLFFLNQAEMMERCWTGGDPLMK